jgi:hypothetical protein
VQHHTSGPVPTVLDFHSDGNKGHLCMSYVDGKTLEDIWDDLYGHDDVKERICRQIWDMIYQFREIPKPVQFAEFYQCGADGTPSNDVLITPFWPEMITPVEYPELDPRSLAGDDDLR